MPSLCFSSILLMLTLPIRQLTLTRYKLIKVISVQMCITVLQMLFDKEMLILLS
jgi:hypothetical protein